MYREYACTGQHSFGNMHVTQRTTFKGGELARAIQISQAKSYFKSSNEHEICTQTNPRKECKSFTKSKILMAAAVQA